MIIEDVMSAAARSAGRLGGDDSFLYKLDGSDDDMTIVLLIQRDDDDNPNNDYDDGNGALILDTGSLGVSI